MFNLLLQFIMLGLVLIFFIGKAYFDLAKNHNKEYAWLYAVLAIALYYGFLFISLFVIVGILEYSSPMTLYNMNEYLLGIMGVPFGLLAVWAGHLILKKRFSETNEFENDALLDEGFNDFD